jgi:hypothetical protein
MNYIEQLLKSNPEFKDRYYDYIKASDSEKSKYSKYLNETLNTWNKNNKNQKINSNKLKEYLYKIGLAGVVLFYGESSIGKSSFLYKLSKLIAIPDYYSRSWEDLEINHGKVLIFQLEESKKVTKKRFNDVLDNPNFQENIIFGDRNWSLGQIEQLRNVVKKTSPKLVIIDSLSKANHSYGGDPNKPEYANFIFDLQKVAQEFNCLIVINHHTRKDGSTFAGTQKLKDNVDMVIRFDKDDNCRLIKIEKDRLFDNQDITYKINLDKENNEWIYCGEYEDEDKNKNKSNNKSDPKQEKKNRVLKLINEATENNGITKKDLQDNSQFERRTLENYLKELNEEDKIYESDKKYFLVKETIDTTVSEVKDDILPIAPGIDN